MILALKYRPQVFTDVTGQRPRMAVLYQMARRGTIPAGLLFTGPRGCGKTSTARIVGAALNCAAGPGPGSSWPCRQCPSCKSVAAGSSLDVMEIDAASHGSVADIHELRSRVLYGSGGEWRVVIIDEAHAISGPGFDALLKVLEEPPPRTSFILVTTAPGKIPATVASRCLPFPFQALPAAVIRERLEYICAAEDITVGLPLLSLFAEHADGAMRDAVMLLEQAAAVGITAVEEWRRLHGEQDFAPVLLGAAARGDHAALYAALDGTLSWAGDLSWVIRQLTACLRDVLVLTAGGDIAAQGHALDLRRDLASRVSPVRAVAAMRVLWDWQTRLAVPDRRAGLELAVALIADKLCPAAQEAPAAAACPPVDMNGLQAMLGGAK